MTLFIRTTHWCRYTATGEWAKRIQHIGSGEFYSVVETSKILSSAEKWPELKSIMGNKTQKDKITFLLLYAESRV